MSIQIESTRQFARWEQFQQLTVKIVAVLADQFPHAVALDPNNDALLGKPVVGRDELNYWESARLTRESVLLDAIHKFKTEIDKAVLARIQSEFDAASSSEVEAPTSWCYLYQKSKERAFGLIESDEKIQNTWRMHKAISQHTGKVDYAEFDPNEYLRLSHFRFGMSLEAKLQEMAKRELETIMKGRGITASQSDLDSVIEYLLHEAEASTENTRAYLNSAGAQVEWCNADSKHSNLLIELIRPEFAKELNNQRIDWEQAKRWGDEHQRRQQLQDTFAGTLNYLLDAGIVTQRTKDKLNISTGRKDSTYTLTPAIIAPLMASTAKSTGESGFQTLSRVRASSESAFTELAKEAAQIIFTSATIGLGKLVMGAG